MKTDKPTHLKVYFVALTAFWAAGCGQIRLGSATFNDPAPSGTIVASGPFFGLNGKAVSGAVSVYSTGGQSYVIRLNGVTFPDENGLQMISVINGATQPGVTLRGTTGTQNYSVTAEALATFSQIRVYSPTVNQDYALATLQ